jgi:hypothetical protein
MEMKIVLCRNSASAFARNYLISDQVFLKKPMQVLIDRNISERSRSTGDVDRVEYDLPARDRGGSRHR